MIPGLNGYLPPSPPPRFRDSVKVLATINFSHSYMKLDSKCFTTIRSIHYLRNHEIKVGDKVIITLKKQFDGYAYVVAFYSTSIERMPLRLLKFDANQYEKVPISDHQDFIDLLNSFSNRGGNHRMQTMKSIITLVRCPK